MVVEVIQSTKSLNKIKHNYMSDNAGYNSENAGRRKFVKHSILVTISGFAGVGLVSGCKEQEEKKAGEGQEVSPPEDLMQEHGVLNRILLIYDHCKTELTSKKSIPLAELGNAASIIRTFVEDYHEKQEEDYLFPRFKKAHQLTDLVDVLMHQHQSGRKLTDQILQITRSKSLTESEGQKLTELLTQFNLMYRPHEAREDTVLFPTFRKIVSTHEYDSLGEEFEKNEHKLFGEDGFEAIVNNVAEIEKHFGIYELEQFTPNL